MSVFRPVHNYRRPLKFIPTAAQVQTTSLPSPKIQPRHREEKSPIIQRANPVLTDRASSIIYQNRRHYREQEYFLNRSKVFIHSLTPTDTSLIYQPKRRVWSGDEWRQTPKRFIPSLTQPADASLIYTPKVHHREKIPWRTYPQYVLPTGTAAPADQSLIWKDYTSRDAVLDIIRQLEDQRNYHYKVKYEPNLLTVAPAPTPLAIAAKPRIYQQEEFYNYWQQRHYRLRPVVFADEWVLFTLPDEGNFNANAIIQPLWRIYFYIAGTQTDSEVAALGNGSLLHCNPVIVDRYGNVPVIYTNSEVTYDISICNEFGVERHFIEGY